MPAQRFLIAPYDKDSGLVNNVRPWIIPDTAFSSLNNAYVWRGRVRKRVGSRYMSQSDPLLSRFRVKVGTITSGGLSAIVPAAAGSVGQQFSISTNIFTVNVTGTPAALLKDGTATTATFNTSTGAFVFAGVPVADTTPVYWYPALPVMGLLTMVTAEVNDFLIGFDTRYAYQYNNGWERLFDEVTGGAATWTGTDAQFFWGTTWTGATASEKIFFVTNFNNSEPNFMRFFDPSTSKWDNFRPKITATPTYLTSALLIVVFHNRLVCLNTWENGLNYTNRARYSWVGNPLDTNAFLGGTPGNGSAIDATTTESIVSAEFIKDRLIVYFEQSTWELVYQGNQAYPFAWQQINTELGSDSTFSVVPFDKVALGIGNVGVHACNGSNVERIDEKIPDQVFAIVGIDFNPTRVYGIRDYFTELVYWTFPSILNDSNNYFPKRMFVYNYRNSTWAFFDDSITVFGYWTPINDGGVTWDSTTVTWDDPVPWGGATMQPQIERVIGGNQEGFTFIFDADIMTNAAVLQITNVSAVATGTQLNIINHNLNEGDYIYIENCAWDDASDGLNGFIFYVNAIYDMSNLVDPNNIIISGISAEFTGNYLGGGLVSRVSNIDIQTKEFNFFAEQGRNAYIPKVEFLVDTTPSGQITVNYFVSTSTVPLLQDSAITGTLVGTGVLETFPYPSVPFERDTTRVWHPVYFQGDGEVVQFQLTMSGAQMVDPTIRDQDFELHALMIYAEKTSSRFQ